MRDSFISRIKDLFTQGYTTVKIIDKISQVKSPKKQPFSTF